ncbi:MAG: PBP1A family penicillin-binding protein [Longimicrobiales bacterium]|nr:PBP1A family penicillin-binding protein [Longimicrobiales bacterium]
MLRLPNPFALRLPRIVALALVFLLAGGVGVAFGSWRNLCATCPSIAQIRTFEPQQTSKLFDSEGELIIELGIQRRTPVSIDALPEHVAQAVIAIEDKRFYRHNGFDPIGFARAVLGVVTGRYAGGGSTITQQLARNMFVDKIGFDRAYVRKLRELQVSWQLEDAYTKDQILESYLNQVYMGRGYGYQTAARSYFGKDASQMNVAEAALLAAILNRPGFYNPYTNPEPTRARRDIVLNLMAEQGYLPEEEVERWKSHPLPESDHSSDSVHGIAPYFEEWVRQILDSRFGNDVYTRGLRVYTTLDREMQIAARESMEWGWAQIEARENFGHEPYSAYDTVDAFPGETPYLQGMFIALDPATGGVRAMIGGRDFEQSKFDRARLARRQAGSAFKPFVYAAAIASGIPASHIVVDQPVVYSQVSGEDWRPRNFSQEFQGPITIREGLRRSINMIAIKLGWEEVGIETVAQTARRMGIQTEIERFPSTTIGAAEVIPLQLVEAYTAFATLGEKVRPFPIVRVEDASGNVLWEPQPERTRVLEPEAARIMVDMLQDAANRGTGANHRNIGLLPYAVPTAGKTGTTNDGTDTWFMGFTPNLTAGVWFGMDRPIPMTDGTSPQATGGGYSAPVWGRFMKHVYYGMGDLAEEGETVPPGYFVEPQLEIPGPWPLLPELITREVDAKSGLLWSRWCSEENRYTEIYIPGTEPTEVCDDTGRFRRGRDLPGIGRRR